MGVVARIALGLAAGGLLAGCGGAATSPGVTSPPASTRSPMAAAASSVAQPAIAAALSDRGGASWSGRPGDTVRIDWYDQTAGEAHGELVTVLAVRRVPLATDAAPNEFGDDIGPYEWKYAVKVRLTSLDETTARNPVAWQFLALSDGVRTETGVAGLAARRGPDPSRVGKGSVGLAHDTH